jgi:CelD/BcsL family acetyltransferase involved in cellulose biosynthesis
VLTALMIRRLIEEDGVRVLDFGRGDDPYKRLWVGSRRQRIGLVLADPLSPLGLAALGRQWAGALLRRLRRRLTAPSPAPAAR